MFWLITYIANSFKPLKSPKIDFKWIYYVLYNNMKKWLIILLLLFTSCNTQKHVQMDRLITTENKIDITEKTDKNTTKFIVITKYKEKKDSVTGEYPIESVTEIKEVNNDKITTQSKIENNEETKEQVKEDIKKGSDVKWYIICFIAGIISTIIVIVLIKLLILYLKRGV